MKPNLLVAASCTFIVVVVGACSGSDAQSTPTTKPAARSTTTTGPPPVAPLTGLVDPGGGAQTRPVVSIKIDNDSSLARPQTGIDQADIVWDEVVEGQGTRFLAMFQSQSPEVVGPVRSVRLTDPLIVWPVGGVFAYSGGAKYAVDGISLAPVKRVDESAAGPAMFRDSSRRPPHNLYARPGQLFAVGGVPVPPPALFDYSRVPVTQGRPVTAVRIGFSGEFGVTYTWNATTGMWPRSTSAGPFLVKGGAQIAPKNVVVLAVPYAGGVGKIGAEAQLVGQGPVKVFTNGRVIEGTWSRSEKAAPMKFLGADGKPILLTPGNTWVELPDVTYAINITEFVPTTIIATAPR